MSTIKNVGELRALIAELPDDMPVTGYREEAQAHNLDTKVSVWITDPKVKCMNDMDYDIPVLVVDVDVI